MRHYKKVIMASIGSKLFESDGGSSVAGSPGTSEPQVAVRSFKFESPKGDSKEDHKKKLIAIAAGAGVLLVAAVVLWMEVREKNGEGQKPIIAKVETESKLQSLSGGTVAKAAPAPEVAASAQQAAPIETTTVASAAVAGTEAVAPSGDGGAKEAQEATAIAIETKEITPQQAKPKTVSKPKPPVVVREFNAFLIKRIDEREVLVEFENTEYIVRRGQALPDGKSVFIGFDKTESIMRTTAGDFRIGS